ncbi:MAG: BrnA antitoxin family protein [Proteobacteria bacterium]|nr:BrnA antitoxin family protein [Pseudomonadota bacterium]MCL2308521.1 BrnA antitoxin family protein [Pseudomonadota bacterium]
MVSYTQDTLPPITEARLDEMKAQAVRSIDTSDIPEMTDEQFKAAVKSRLHRPLKKQLTTNIDADVLEWLRSQGKGYHTRLNAILRDAMLRSLR